MRLTRRAVLEGLVAAGVGAASGTGAYGYRYERHKLEVTRVSVSVVGLPPALGGLRVGVITDIHRSYFVSHTDVIHAAARLMDEHPDLIVLGGDYVTNGGGDNREYVQPSAEALGSLSARYGVYGILGNHDDDHDMPAALTARGVEMLKDVRTRVMVKGEPIDLVGIRYWTRRGADLASLVRGATGTVILLAHDPRRLNEASALNIPLVLSGHTHGGQVVLPHIGAIAARKFPVIAGIGRRGRTTMFVSRGVGTIWLPVRVNCPPEVAVLTLRSDGTPTA